MLFPLSSIGQVTKGGGPDSKEGEEAAYPDGIYPICHTTKDLEMLNGLPNWNRLLDSHPVFSY